MRIIFGTTVVSSAGTAVRLLNTLDDVKKIQVHTRAGNTGRMFLGLSDVSATVNGWEFEIPVAARPLAHYKEDFGEGSVKANTFFADATVNGESIDWTMVVRS